MQDELLAQQLRADSLLTADELSEQTGGAGNGNGRAPIRPVINGNFEAALNAASDVAGLTQPMAEMHGALAELQAVQAEGRIESMRAAMRAAGMANVPEGFERAWVAGGAMVRDHGATVDKLQAAYQDFLTDRRYTETWGANWRDVRVGRSQMTVREFESTTLKLQQQAANEAYERGKVALATGELPLENAGYAVTLGNYVDKAVRLELRAFGIEQGLPDSSASNKFAVNRLIRGAGTAGIPDLRTGANQISDVTLSRKDGTYDQLRRWNAIVPNDTIIIRPEGLPGGGSYVVPRATIRPAGVPGKGA